MSELTDRINGLLKERGYRRADLSRSIQISDSTIRTWETRNASPSVEAAFKVAQFFGVTVEFLLTGKNPSESPSLYLASDEEEIIDIYRSLDKRGKEELKKIAKVLELCYNGGELDI